MIKEIDRYLIRRILPILLAAFLLAGVMLFMERLLRLLEMTVDTGVSFLVVLQMLMNLTPHYIQLILPLGLFFSVLLTFRDLSSHSELYVMESCGLGVARLMRAPAMLGALTCAVGFAITGYLEPGSRYTYNLLGYNVQNGLVRSGLEEGSFINLPNDYTIRVSRSHAGGTKFTDFFGYKQLQDGKFETLTAPRGYLGVLPDRNEIALKLINGRRTTWFEDGSEAETINFDEMTLPFDIEEIPRFRGRGLDARELFLHELVAVFLRNQFSLHLGDLPGSALEQGTQISARAIAAELHGRLIYTLSILLMPFLAVPFAIVSIRSSRAGGLIAGSVALVTYQKVLEFGEEIASVSQFPVGTFLWGTFSVFTALTVTLFVATARATGVTPFQRFEEALLSGFKGMVPRRRPAVR